MASSVNNSAWVEWMTTLMGGASRQAHAAAFPPDRFYCLLDELPLHLIPLRNRQCIANENQQHLFLNPACTLYPAGQLPDGLVCRKEVQAAFALRGTIAWVQDAATGNMLPFWLGPELEAAVRRIKPGEPVPDALTDEARRVLRAAGILLPSRDTDDRDQEREQSLEKAALMFPARSYAPISGLIHPFHIAAMRRYYRHQIRTGAIGLGDKQSARRYVAYNEPVARFFHQGITSTLSRVAGQLLKPSYVYMASYLCGAELKKHTDRAQCEFSVTLCLDFSPEPEAETEWPIQLDTPSGTATVYQALGDGLAYRGTRLPHYRSVLPEGQTSTSIFFHYVSDEFAGPLD